MSTADFTYSPEQWERIKCVVLRLGKDADRIVGRYGGSLRNLIEIEANMLINHGDPNSRLNCLGANHQAYIDKLIALRDNAMNIRDSIVASHTLRDEDDKPLMHRVEANMLDASEAYINKLTLKIDLLRAPRISIRPPRIEPASNASKANREHYWSCLLAVWCEIGGSETGAYAAKFLIAASKPVFDRCGTKDRNRAIPSQKSVEQWLSRRQKARR